MIDSIGKHILSFLILWPLVAAFCLFLIPNAKDKTLKTLALISLVIELILSLHLLKHFDIGAAGFQFSESYSWLPAFLGIHYTVGIDGISLLLILLTTTIFALAGMGFFYFQQKSHTRSFLALTLLALSAIVGVFSSLDVFMFYIFWELSLIPVYFLVGFWGQSPLRVQATQKIFLYGLTGSLCMLLALVYLYVAHGTLYNGVYTTNLVELYQVAQTLDLKTQTILFFAITVAFLIKAPVFPFHRWLLAAYEEAPVFYTFLSGVILKLSVYGMIRFSLSLFPAVSEKYSFWFIGLGIVTLFYGAFAAARETDMKRLMAYSSMSHLGLITAGIFSLTTIGLQGSLYQMINHAITSLALFIVIQIISQETGSTSLNLKGFAKSSPALSVFFMIGILSAAAVPGTGTFIGEWLILLGIFSANQLLGLIAILSVVVGAVYMLLLAHKAIWGPGSEQVIKLKTMQFVQLFVLVLAVFALGFCSKYVLQYTAKSVERIEEPFHSRTLSGIAQK